MSSVLTRRWRLCISLLLTLSLSTGAASITTSNSYRRMRRQLLLQTTLNKTRTALLEPPETTTVGSPRDDLPPLARESGLQRPNAYPKRVVTPVGGFPRGGQQPSNDQLRFFVSTGVCLAFNSGFINGVCLGGLVSAAKQAVAAVTGTYTTSALAAATGEFAFMQTQLIVLLSYISGSAISGALNPKPKPFQVAPTSNTTFYAGSLLLLTATALARGMILPSAPKLSIYCLAAMANGMQNSLTSVHTSNLIRTSHYSGMSSDIGTFVGQALAGNTDNVWKLKIFVSLALSFWTGGFLSYFVGRTMTSSSLLVSALLYGCMGLYFQKQYHKQQQPLQNEPKLQEIVAKAQRRRLLFKQAA